MPVRLLRRSTPGYGALGNNAQIHLGIGYALNTELGFAAPPFVVTAGTSVDSDPILVAGYNNFMLLLNISNAGGSVTASYVIDDPPTQAQIVARQIAAGLPAGISISSFGAYGTAVSVTFRGDVFHTITLRIAAVTSNQTINDVRLWAGVR